MGQVLAAHGGVGDVWIFLQPTRRRLDGTLHNSHRTIRLLFQLARYTVQVTSCGQKKSSRRFLLARAYVGKPSHALVTLMLLQTCPCKDVLEPNTPLPVACKDM